MPKTGENAVALCTGRKKHRDKQAGELGGFVQDRL